MDAECFGFFLCILSALKRWRAQIRRTGWSRRGHFGSSLYDRLRRTLMGPPHRMIGVFSSSHFGITLCDSSFRTFDRVHDVETVVRMVVYFGKFLYIRGGVTGHLGKHLCYWPKFPQSSCRQARSSLPRRNTECRDTRRDVCRRQAASSWAITRQSAEVSVMVPRPWPARQLDVPQQRIERGPIVDPPSRRHRGDAIHVRDVLEGIAVEENEIGELSDGDRS